MAKISIVPSRPGVEDGDRPSVDQYFVPGSLYFTIVASVLEGFYCQSPLIKPKIKTVS